MPSGVPVPHTFCSSFPPHSSLSPFSLFLTLLSSKIPNTGEKQVEITDLPDWAQPAFKGMKSLNRVQSRVSDCALYSSENMLVCAPTGAWGCLGGGVRQGCWGLGRGEEDTTAQDRRGECRLCKLYSCTSACFLSFNPESHNNTHHTPNTRTPPQVLVRPTLLC